MSSLAASDQHAALTPAKVIQPAWVRTVHWINAVAIVLMIMSGWQIYNASPLFGFKFSSNITLGGWLGGALLLHFAAMWLLVVNRLRYLTPGFGTRRLRQELLARRRAALAYRCDVAADGQRPRLSHAGFCHRPLPQEAAADHAGGRDCR